MRIKEKQNILEFIQQLETAIPDGVNDAAVLGMAAEVADAIEKLCHKAAKERIDLYTEVFSGLRQALTAGSEENSAEARQQIVSLALDIMQNIKEVLEKEPAKKEIVFLPYNASMWDSLESVWRAAAADKENCNAYVVPIPYADRNPDGSVKSWHYEINDFPDDVPVIDCNTIDLAAMHPDAIFIHNPYDGYNRVTSVDSRYYSSELVKYTDKLIYIPYYVQNDDNNTPESVAHLANTPGVINAHVTILESEAVRKCYIEALSKIYGEKSRPVWEEKIKGWGSPKFDKIKNVTKADVQIPDEWLKLIKKPDGSWKKVILYNNSIATLLNYDMKVMTKIKKVFEIFKDNLDEVTLWWRPHPLLAATIDSMQPELKEEYDSIVAQYKKAGWGIYDDTKDLNRAVAACDAYYGDPSSVTPLFQRSGKPVMIEEVDIL